MTQIAHFSEREPSVMAITSKVHNDLEQEDDSAVLADEQQNRTLETEGAR